MIRRISKLAKRRVDTRRLYRFEEEELRGRPLLPISLLRRLARRIWKKSARRKMPQVVAGRGDLYNGRLYSYYDGDRIVLARNERRKFVLIHEIVHALGNDNHDKCFVKKYHSLLCRYDSKISPVTLASLKCLAPSRQKSPVRMSRCR